MVSGYPTSTNILWFDGLSTDPREMGRHKIHFLFSFHFSSLFYFLSTFQIPNDTKERKKKAKKHTSIF